MTHDAALMIRPKRIDCPKALAEGRCAIEGERVGIPYSMDVMSADDHIHFWLDTRVAESGLIEILAARAIADRPIGSISYSDGQPSGFWSSTPL